MIECPNGFYRTNSQTCQQCQSNCQKCQNESYKNLLNQEIDDVKCLECEDGFFKMNQNCVQKCPDTYYGSILTKSCERCPTNCLVCEDKDPQICKICQNGWILWREDCQNKSCQPGYFSFYDTKSDQRECHKCRENCSICSSDQDCLTCYSPYLLHEDTCVADCPIGFEQNANHSCVQSSCSEGCQLCSSPSQCTKCTQSASLPYELSPQGACLPCTEINGLSLSCNECLEECGDDILYKLTPHGHNCDDGNSESGDGCDSDCRIEAGYTCIREFKLDNLNYKIADICRKKFKIEFYRNGYVFDQVEYLLKFTSLSKETTKLLNL